MMLFLDYLRAHKAFHAKRVMEMVKDFEKTKKKYI
jgi:predicted secreted Zn-dependent protease